MRLRRGMSVSELAQKAGIDRSYVHRIEKNPPERKVTLEVAERISKTLGLQLWEFLKP